MSKWELILCKPSGEEKIKNPDWNQIKSYLDQVDGDRRRDHNFLDALCLINPDIGEMNVFGGNEIDGRRLYAIIFFPAECDYEKQYMLLNPEVQTRGEEYELITNEGVGIDFNKEWLVEYDPMIQAFKHFFETGKLDDTLEWDEW
ncbi:MULTISPECIES: hypothetical protein [Thermoactinomyces]|jgi:hypothetical protein|uniref:Uncharacterized protein n=1 Tax=Thermoactinomyces vulgaris TaxID=2026 RepID=A0ABS0QIY0_THEVU|nr:MULTISPECIES: hypothetical protein [Thermoactinomyces]KYQ88010.1 hypothetical protein AYX07_04875 [Thermoactinomyces sp. AS95]MBA4552206.1 hypothetical protein [Thermoactinomyces vulgaris]MBA4597587.1 hypothetical protein [Thermoactinomyces vulgaris]MBH8589150.1 hypothetical protein [Thermoactinomyces vulgaris]MBI0387748.1 hypothetical protein [Thermoactinomyces sp. CICC 24227]